MHCPDSSLITHVGGFEIFSSVKYGNKKVAEICMNLFSLKKQGKPACFEKKECFKT